MYLWLGNVLLVAFASAFFISNQLQLRWVVVTLPTSALLVAVTMVIWYSCSQQKTSILHNEDLRQSLLEDYDDSEEDMPGGHERKRSTSIGLVDSGGLRGSIEGLRQVGSADGADSDDEMAEARRGTGLLVGSASDNMTELEAAHAHDPVVEVEEGDRRDMAVIQSLI